MPVGQVEGAALLVAGYGAPGARSFDASTVHTLGQIGEALYATGLPWHVRRLTSNSTDRYAADRKTIKRSLTDLVHDPVRVAVVVMLGEIIEVAGELALVTGEEAYEYPEDATLPLSWIREKLASCIAAQLVVAISACGPGDPATWLGALGTKREHHVVAIDRPSDGAGNPMIDALLSGLCGDALDRQTGTVTMASLSSFLASHTRAIQSSPTDDTVAQPPPLAGLWDVRQSQLARARPRRAADAPEDLAGLVLPGRFRLDELIERGTFGAVYRARQLAVERDVAIKVLNADIDPASDDGKLFVHEIRAVGRIDHRNVVRIFQADIMQDGRLFFAMELLVGDNLQTLGADQLSVDRAVALVRQLLDGLGAAHAAGLVHADIKPANAIVIPPRPIDLDDPEGESTPERVVLVDFGLARLRAKDSTTESAGGTPAFMAPEQLTGRIDHRSDLFSAALVLLWLITGWRRRVARTLVPPDDVLAKIEDPDLRAVLRRALDVAPAKRYQSARELAAALVDAPVPTPDPAERPAPPPFRQLAPLTESDRDRLQGRDADVATITEYALYRQCVVYAAPSGTGKTSTLRAGLMPRLEALGIYAAYVPCRTDPRAEVIRKISPGAASIEAAITEFHSHRGGKLVLVVDQLETALHDPAFVRELLAFDRWPRDADVSIVLSIREDYLARLLDPIKDLAAHVPIVRLPPLSLAGARAAITTPLHEHRLEIEPALLEQLLRDLERAASSLGPEMGWGDTPAVFPPHLQLACSVLYESIEPEDEGTLTLARYRRLGGFAAIVGEHLERVLETELTGDQTTIARDVFLALVTGSNQRAIRTETELLAIATVKHDRDDVLEVLEVLRSRGLLVRVRVRGDAGASWELVHDSLVARVQSWIDRKDLSRRRAIETVRYHLRRSTPESPSLLHRKELRELARHDGAVDELEHEWATRQGPDDIGWTPRRLVARSRTVLARTRGAVAAVVFIALAVGGIGLYTSHVEAAHNREEEHLKLLDLGRFTLALTQFDWDPKALKSTPASAPTEFRWTLHVPDPDDPDQPGEAYAASWVVRGTPTVERDAVVESVETHGGRAYLVVTRPGCTESVVPIADLPGYTKRENVPPRLEIAIPSCAATRAGMIEIPAGPFIFGGRGDPPAKIYDQFPQYAVERTIDLPRFWIDRTEVTNAQFATLTRLAITGIDRSYATAANVPHLGEPDVPVSGIDWREARAFCRYFGKRLPTTEQWTKAMRGGLMIDGLPNPTPRRSLPWPSATTPSWIGDSLVAIGYHADDVSPYGVRDLAGNVMEWTSTISDKGRAVRGGSWDDVHSGSQLINYVAIDNSREPGTRNYNLGVRCVR